MKIERIEPSLLDRNDRHIAPVALATKDGNLLPRAMHYLELLLKLPLYHADLQHAICR